MNKAGAGFIGKVALPTLLLYGSLFGAYVGTELGLPLADVSPVLSARSVGGPHPLWLVSWPKVAAVIAAVLLYSIAVVAWVRGRYGHRAEVVASVAIFLLAVVGILVLLWPELSYALGDRERSSRLDNWLVRSLDGFPGGVIGQVVAGAIVQTVAAMAILKWLVRAEPAAMGQASA